MSVAARGFSLLEMLIALAISSVLLLASARFLPALQRTVLQQDQQQMLEEELWQRAYIVARHLQRAGYCGADRCAGRALHQEPGCVLIRWDTGLASGQEERPMNSSDVTGFRLREGALETLRGAANCAGKGWERMTEPDFIQLQAFDVMRQQLPGFAPSLTVTLSGRLQANAGAAARASVNVTAYNL